MTHTFQHRFKGGITVTLTYSADDIEPGKIGLDKCEWSVRPTARIIPEYIRWKHSVCERLSELINGRVMDLIETGRGPIGWEAWIYDPGKPGRKVSVPQQKEST